MSDYDSCPKSTLYLDNRQIKGIQTGQKGYRNFLEILFARSRHSLNFVAAHKPLANQVLLVLLAHSYRISPGISDIL